MLHQNPTNDIQKNKKKSMHTSWVEMIIGAKEGHWFIIRRIQVKTDKKGQNEKTCALACLKETAAVETSSFILRF